MKKSIAMLLLIGVAFILNAAPAFALTDPFSDTSPSLMDTVTYLADRGIIEGYPDGTIRLDNDINRAEVTKILVEGNGVTPDPLEYNNCFNDVIDDWYAPYVCYANEQGWVEGYADGNFKPAQTIIRVEVIKLILVSQGYDIPSDAGLLPYEDVVTTEWYAPYVQVAYDHNLIPEVGIHLNPADEMKRGGAFEILFRALVIDELEVDEYSQPLTDSIFGRDVIQNVQASASNEDVEVTWEAYTGDQNYDSYAIYMKKGTDFETGDIEIVIDPIVVMPSDNQYTFTNLESDTYYFKVGTGYQNTKSNFSETASIIVDSGIEPPIPASNNVENVSSSVFEDNIELVWDAYAGQNPYDSYQIFMKQGSAFEPGDIEISIEPIVVMPSENQYTFTGLENDTYYFMVSTGYQNSKSSYSEAYSVILNYNN